MEMTRKSESLAPALSLHRTRLGKKRTEFRRIPPFRKIAVHVSGSRFRVLKTPAECASEIVYTSRIVNSYELYH